MKATVSFGLKLPIPGQQYSNREVHITLEDELREPGDLANLAAIAKEFCHSQAATFGIPKKQEVLLD